MQDSPSDHFNASPVLLKRPSQSRWSSFTWQLLGIQPAIANEVIEKARQGGELLSLPAMRIQLYPQFCEAYHVNLTSNQPGVYLVCQDAPGAEQPRPLLLTVDFDEAASYMEAGQQVLEAPLAGELCVWLERYVIAHYRPQAPKKRRRQNWQAEQEQS